MDEDLAAFSDWASIFLNPAELTKTVTKHYALHRNAINADIAEEKAHWAAEEWWKAGITAADLMTIAIGPITPVYPTSMVKFRPGCTDACFLKYAASHAEDKIGLARCLKKCDGVSETENMSLLAVPDFIAGLIYGFTGDNDLPEIEACYAGGQQVQVDAMNLLADLKKIDIVNAYKDKNALMRDLKDATTKCTGMDEDIARIEAWAEIFTNPEELTVTVTKNWLLHKRGIEKDIAQEKVDWSNGDYFAAGVDTADALVKLIGPVE